MEGSKRRRERRKMKERKEGRKEARKEKGMSLINFLPLIPIWQQLRY